MKTWKKISLAVLGIATVAVVAGLYFTAGLTHTADQFFSAAQQRDMPGARALLARELRDSLSNEGLTRQLRQQGMSDITRANWSERKVSGGRGELHGTVESKTGGTIPVKLTLVKEDDQWRIQHIEREPAGIAREAESIPLQAMLPGERAKAEMVKVAMHEFTVATRERSMARFHRNISQTWQRQFSVAKLDEAYGQLFDAGDLTVLNQHEPQIEAPRIDGQGVLVLPGHYQLKKARVDFEQRYVLEQGQWKLLAFDLEIRS
jgi:hypothetical protein